MQLKQGVDLKLAFEYEAAQFAQRRSIRGPEKVVEKCKNFFRLFFSRKSKPEKHTKQEKKSQLGEERVPECSRGQKRYSYAKYETNNAAKGTADWRYKVGFLLAEWSPESQQMAGFSLLQTIEYYTKTLKINRILSEE